jgi:hypothetical protein
MEYFDRPKLIKLVDSLTKAKNFEGTNLELPEDEVKVRFAQIARSHRFFAEVESVFKDIEHQRQRSKNLGKCVVVTLSLSGIRSAVVAFGCKEFVGANRCHVAAGHVVYAIGTRATTARWIIG